MKWAIVHGKGKNYFVEWTGIGPRFGGTYKTAAVFRTKREAEREINRFPVVASIMARAVKLSSPKREARHG
jgi:hypothetical protein